ncbi:MipA/OmpV family protein [Oceanobacter kriegii]|uniref:MipA/OmpV family protein n=1 Tax=Oceanobacter kriegii TaxID=64972 RepID=UPI0009FBC598|nr:MipA/OmpV family protein [Oceanobacter kriegii]
MPALKPDFPVYSRVTRFVSGLGLGLGLGLGVGISALCVLPASAEESASAAAGESIEDSQTSSQASAQPSPWNWGIGVVSSRDVYADFDTRVVPFPMITYHGERFHLFGPFARYDLTRIGSANLALQVNPVFAGYDESDSPILQDMDKRGYSMAGGLSLDQSLGNWHWNINATHDLLGVYDGYEAAVGAEYKIKLGSLLLEPGAKAIFQSSDYVDYYYGVKGSEARSWRPEYQADSVVNQQISLALAHQKIAGGGLRLQMTHTRYGKAITDSPLTDRKTALGVNLVYSRFF